MAAAPFPANALTSGTRLVVIGAFGSTTLRPRSARPASSTPGRSRPHPRPPSMHRILRWCSPRSSAHSESSFRHAAHPFTRGYEVSHHQLVDTAGSSRPLRAILSSATLTPGPSWRKSTHAGGWCTTAGPDQGTAVKQPTWTGRQCAPTGSGSDRACPEHAERPTRLRGLEARRTEVELASTRCPRDAPRPHVRRQRPCAAAECSRRS